MASIEHEIAAKFEEIADVGWFPENIAADSAQFTMVRQVLEPLAGKRILDAGCARGRFAKRLAPLGADVHGLDLTETFLQSARTNVPQAAFTRGSLSALPFRSETFDAVYCVEALEHVPDTDAAIREMTRVLKPNGTLLVIDKSLIGLDPGVGLPNFIVKPWAERRGKWMYPADFAFRERWFWPWNLAARIRRHCGTVQIRFIPEGRGKASKLYKLLPFFSLDVAWISTKQGNADTGSVWSATSRG
jgi:ubiquinone/menaquinone biosynthesis C-methylase UbiE